MPDVRLSPHFMLSEFKCHHCGRLPDQHSVGLSALVHGLEAFRTKFYPHGLIVVSGYRCNDYQAELYKQEGPANAAPPGSSQHNFAAACDVDLVAPLQAVRELGAFSGIGWQWSGGHQLVRHVDVRHASGHNLTNSSVATPAIWQYA
jgi:hypothetical protein